MNQNRVRLLFYFVPWFCLVLVIRLWFVLFWVCSWLVCYNVTFIFPIERVKNLVEKKFPNARKVKGGDGYKSTLVLLPLAELITQKNLT